MQRIILYIIIFYLGLASVRAGNTGPQIYVGGTIKNYKLKYIAFSYTRDYLYFQKKMFHLVQTDEDGNFTFTAKWDRAWPLRMIVDEKILTFFLCPGDSLQIDGTYASLDRSAKFSKNAGAGHNLLQSYRNEYNRKNQDFRSRIRKYDSLEFITLNDINYAEQRAFIRKDSALPMSKTFREYMNALVDYYYFNNIFEYCLANRQYFDSTYFYSKFDRKHVNNEYALSIIEYIVFLENYVSWQGELRKSQDRTSKNFWNFRYNITKRLLTGAVKELILARTVKKAFVYANHITAMTLYNDYSNNCNNPEYLQQIKKNFIH